MLRPVDRGDAEAITAGLQDWEVVRWLSSVPWPYSRVDADWFIGEAEAGRMTPFAITRDGAFLGIVSIDRELGYWLSRDHWGHRYMPEAAAALVEAFFVDDTRHSLPSSYLEGNTRSGAVLRGLGFRESGRRMQSSRPLGREVPVVAMELARQDWQARGPGLESPPDLA